MALVGSSWWLSQWTANTYNQPADDPWLYIAIYAALSLLAAALVWFRVVIIAIASLRAGKKLHESTITSGRPLPSVLLPHPTLHFSTLPYSNPTQPYPPYPHLPPPLRSPSWLVLCHASVRQVLPSPTRFSLSTPLPAGSTLHTSVLASPVSFFDQTPLGRVINRLSADLQVVDVQLRVTTQQFFLIVFNLLGTAALLLANSPYIAACMLPLSLLYYYSARYYRHSSRELQRLDSLSKSPLYAAFAEALAGAPTIRATGAVPRFEHGSLTKLDHNLRAGFVSAAANRWLGVRLEAVGNLVVSLSALFAVLSRVLASKDDSGDDVKVNAAQARHRTSIGRRRSPLSDRGVSYQRNSLSVRLGAARKRVRVAHQRKYEYPIRERGKVYEGKK